MALVGLRSAREGTRPAPIAAPLKNARSFSGRECPGTPTAEAGRACRALAGRRAAAHRRRSSSVAVRAANAGAGGPTGPEPAEALEGRRDFFFVYDEASSRTRDSSGRPSAFEASSSCDAHVVGAAKLYPNFWVLAASAPPRAPRVFFEGTEGAAAPGPCTSATRSPGVTRRGRASVDRDAGQFEFFRASSLGKPTDSLGKPAVRSASVAAALTLCSRSKSGCGLEHAVVKSRLEAVSFRRRSSSFVRVDAPSDRCASETCVRVTASPRSSPRSS